MDGPHDAGSVAVSARSGLGSTASQRSAVASGQPSIKNDWRKPAGKADIDEKVYLSASLPGGFVKADWCRLPFSLCSLTILRQMTISESIGWAVVDGGCLPGFHRIGLRSRSPAGHKLATLGVCRETKWIACALDVVPGPWLGPSQLLGTSGAASRRPTDD